MATSGPSDVHANAGQLSWMEQTIDLLRTRGYLTMNVRLGQEEVLIVSGPTGEAAVIDLRTVPTRIGETPGSGCGRSCPECPLWPLCRTMTTLVPKTIRSP